MITGAYWNLHDDEALRKIDEAAVRLLTQSGARIESDQLLNELESAGCRVERSGMRCFFAEKLIRDAVTAFGGASDDAVEIPVGWNPRHWLSHLGSFPHLLEWPSGVRRLATKQDIVDMARMAHALDEFRAVGRVLVCSEVDPRIEPMWTSLAIAETTNKRIIGGEVMLPEQVGPLVRMGEAISGEPGDTTLLAGCDFFIAPLVLDSRQAELFVRKRKYGMKTQPGTMPISGLSSPVTIAGTVAIAVAELLGGWVIGYLLRPDLPADGIVCTGSMDMRTASPCFSSPEALLQDVMTVQLCRRLYGIRIGAATGYVDCKRPGLDAVFHKMLPLVTIPFGLGAGIGGGLLSAGQDYSPVQHLLDTEINDAVRRFKGSFEISEETIALDLIQEQISAGAVDFIGHEHTLEHFKGEQWYPKWFDRTLWQGEEVELEQESRMLQRMDDYCKDAIRRYEPPSIDQAKISELRGIVSSAERELTGAG